MPHIKIVTDSAAHLPTADINHYHITVMNSPILIKGKIFGYVNQISQQKFLKMFDKAGKSPIIGEVSVANLIDTYNKLGADGSQVLSIHLSDTLSHTYANAKVAAEKSTSQVTVVNSRVTSAGLAYQVMTAAKAISASKPLTAILSSMDKVRQKTRIFFSAPNNSQLVNRRLIGRIRGTIENRLNVSYVIEFKDNDFSFVTHGRQDDLVSRFWDKQLAVMHHEPIVQLSILHSGNPDRANFLYKMLTAEFPFLSISQVPTNPEMACFIGSDATGVTYLLG
ncbi:DegV family protein [Lentilactobacillus raoultii]|uniref:DegV family protein n=1 Tax=Lentilactobacillus raoultii TaxID=1987503 RepID=A0ABW3PL19_9LACO|nr:DegV family protein [Lentilactobacillus raoultii]